KEVDGDDPLRKVNQHREVVEKIAASAAQGVETREKVIDMAKEIFCAFGTDVDSVAGWLGSYGGEDSPSDTQRCRFVTDVAVSSLLRLFQKYVLLTSFLIPGHSLESFPEQCRQIIDDGHEGGAHGYSHENPVAMTAAQEEAVLAKSVEVLERL